MMKMKSMKLMMMMMICDDADDVDVGVVSLQTFRPLSLSSALAKAFVFC